MEQKDWTNRRTQLVRPAIRPLWKVKIEIERTSMEGSRKHRVGES